jgi:hypothetical protein
MLGWVGRLSFPAVSKDRLHLKELKGVKFQSNYVNYYRYLTTKIKHGVKFTHPHTNTLIHSLTQPPAHPLTHSLPYPLTHQPTYPTTHASTHYFTHPPAYFLSPNHSSTNLFPHPLNHSLLLPPHTHTHTLPHQTHCARRFIFSSQWSWRQRQKIPQKRWHTTTNLHGSHHGEIFVLKNRQVRRSIVWLPLLTYPTLSHFRSGLFAPLPLISCALHSPLILFITSTAQSCKYRSFSRQELISRKWSSTSKRPAASPYLFHVANWLSSLFRFRTSEALNILDRPFTIIYVMTNGEFFVVEKFFADPQNATSIKLYIKCDRTLLY